VLLDDFAPQSGESFLLFDAETLAGVFAEIDFTAAALGEGLMWDTSALATTGILAVSTVPEPSATLLVLLGLAFALFFQRRSRSAGFSGGI